MKKKLPLKYIKFWDHFAGSRKIVSCEVVGWVLEEDDKQIVLSWWVSGCEDDGDFDNNLEPFAIIKSTIIKEKLLK